MTAVDIPFPTVWTPCQTTDPELYFPEKGGKLRETEAVKTLCKTKCPADAFAACLEIALANNYEGIWAGLTDRDRRELKRIRRGA